MMSTNILIATFIAFLMVWGVIWACFLRLGLHWANVPDVTTRQVVKAVTIVFLLQLPMDILSTFFPSYSDAQSNSFVLTKLAVTVIVPWMVIYAVFKIRFWRAFKAWLPTLLTTSWTIVLVLFVLRPFVYEAFILPTNAMAPTLVGHHWQGICPECGRPNYCTAIDPRFDPPAGMICDNFHVTKPANVDKQVHASDRLMVAKFLMPRRWDLAVFQKPADPSKIYVMRLVGLPGEKIHIEDGSVWADGRKLTPPDEIRGIAYVSQLPWRNAPALWGSVDRPALLGDDEYFVLGDFSMNSVDSRYWQKGAPGHNPYAVPESHMKGVVTHTYWPFHRWRIHR